DNYLAEALARVAAAASGRPASFGGATETLLATVEELGVPVEGLSIGDASGLSRQNAVTPAQLAGVLQVMATSDDPALAGVLQALPVAGLSGTLSERFTSATGKAAAGEGMVRAKTGTLNAVTALSGYVVTTEGRLLTFSFVATGLNGNTREARTAADNAAAVLAVCGCR
ncbi:D-alanyl-D-alanine carboxypeptidase/D-alanyl-D-alanine endopeptidase, partial [Arthrobacter sp. H41]|uniref:D-alanyl-D-alanine carboxypeptidase/D-alanyl-D-alanine endopeptidase n=1 Tax=Arthrobacter sp. H41 TaxID=1312978 RepID=UPI0009DCED1A